MRTPTVNRMTVQPLFLAAVVSTAVFFMRAPVCAQSPAAPRQSGTAAEEAIELKPFAVVEQQPKGYRVSTASTATRTNTALIDIPQTVDIVTSELWNDI